ncbi:hypothetical protein N7526_006600 [Penicillium atrosanguineum]|nr:hypothetical protein N7526_006600 [Penicillium atrosanguineum]
MTGNQSKKHQKRSRGSDAAEKVSRSSDDRTKRRRTSEVNDAPMKQLATPSIGDPPSQDMEKRKGSAPWSFSRPVGGRYSNLDPILTKDEAYLFVGLDTAVQVFSTSTSRLLRTMQMEAGQRVIGFKICPIDQDTLFIFTSGFVTKWNWQEGKRHARWGTISSNIAVDLPTIKIEEHSATYFSVGTQKDGKREISVNALNEKKPVGTTVLRTNENLNTIKIAYEGRVIFASDGTHLFLGTTAKSGLENPESAQYSWREATLPATATSLDLRESSSTKGPEAVDLVVGESDGSILIYQDILNTLFGRNTDKKFSPRKMHWHRGPVSTVRWSMDGNYIISGGQESVLVLWQLDTGRKQFLPHLSSPICNVIVSPSGNSYVVKLADNSVMVMSTREMQPSATVTGLQLASEVGGHRDPSARKPFGSVAVLHPQHPERLLVAVPASHSSQQGSQRSNAAVLQTFDIRANSHISRQALARTNTTTLNVSPEGSPIVAPDVRLMDIMHDGKWLATVDTWTPHPRDIEAIASSDSTSLLSEVFLKFWKWNASSDMWELVTRIDAPHFSENRSSTVLGLAARPYSHEFATLGADSNLRFWRPTTRHRSGLKTDPSEPHLDTWKCRSSVDLTGWLDNADVPLKSASISFSEDGSVLAVCLPSDSGSNDGLVLLVNAQNCTVHYRRTGVFFKNPCSVRFLGRYLIVAATGSVSVWDTVDDVVKPIHLSDSVGTVDTWSPLLAVNSRTQSFAIATRGTDSSSSNVHKKRRKLRFHIKIYDLPSLNLVFQENLGSCPLGLLSDAYSGDYIVVDATASVQRLGCLDKASQKSLQPHEVTSHLNSGLASIFSRGQERISNQAIDEDSSAGQSKGLAGVFGETPSFSLPSISVLFRNVVRTLGSS